MIGFVNIQDWLQAEKRLEALREEIQDGKLIPIQTADCTEHTLVLGGSLVEPEVLRRKEQE
jgi:hypothetical protein